MPSSYIKYLFDSFLGTDLNAQILDTVTVVIFFIVVLVSVLLNYKDWKHSRISSEADAKSYKRM